MRKRVQHPFAGQIEEREPFIGMRILDCVPQPRTLDCSARLSTFYRMQQTLFAVVAG